MIKHILRLLFLFILSITLISCDLIDELPNNNQDDPTEETEPDNPNIEEEEESKEKNPEDFDIFEDGIYITKDEVAIYIFFFDKLPSNYVKKGEINGHISNYWTPSNKLSIGGDNFQNREGLLPKKQTRRYFEADIDYRGERGRNAKRIVYSNDGLIFYTSDHYGSFVEFNTEDFTWNY